MMMWGKTIFVRDDFNYNMSSKVSLDKNYIITSSDFHNFCSCLPLLPHLPPIRHSHTWDFSIASNLIISIVFDMSQIVNRTKYSTCRLSSNCATTAAVDGWTPYQVFCDTTRNGGWHWQSPPECVWRCCRHDKTVSARYYYGPWHWQENGRH